MPHGCEWKCSSECKKVACTTGRISSLLFTAGFIYCCLVIQLCPTLCNPVDFSMLGFPVLHYLLEFAQTHVHWVSDAIQLISSCYPLLLLPSVFPSISVFSNESDLCIRWPKNLSFSFSISPSNEYSELISFRIDWFDLALQGTLKSLPQHHSLKASIPWHGTHYCISNDYSCHCNENGREN